MRLKDKGLLADIRNLPCLACRIRPSDAHHVTSRGAGGDDIPENVMPLCRKHHQEWHQIGPGKMCQLYPEVEWWLTTMGREDVLNKIYKSDKPKA